jgi:AcrR family transcriptional regulator
MDERKPPKRAGRPKDPLFEQRILDVALAQLREQGYARLSMDQVAAAAGVSKPAIYRRWKGKVDLATAALRKLQISEPEVRDKSTPGQLRGVIENFRKSLLRPHGMALVGTVLAEEAHTPGLLRLFRERLVVPRRSALRTILRRAKAQGELRAGAAIEPAVAMLVGAVYAQYLAESKVSAAFARQAVEAVWISVRK